MSLYNFLHANYMPKIRDCIIYL